MVVMETGAHVKVFTPPTTFVRSDLQLVKKKNICYFLVRVYHLCNLLSSFRTAFEVHEHFATQVMDSTKVSFILKLTTSQVSF